MRICWPLYRKLHLPYIGIDRFLNHGDLPLKVYDTDIGRIGLGICYDLDLSEHARTLTLLGAEVIVTITNWPEGIEFIPEHMVPTRARENHVYQIAVNRVGDERGVRFFGRSKFADCTGASIAEGMPYQEDILYAEVDPALAGKETPGDYPWRAGDRYSKRPPARLLPGAGTASGRYLTHTIVPQKARILTLNISSLCYQRGELSNT